MKRGGITAKIKGKEAEKIAIYALNTIGINMVEKIGTPIRIIDKIIIRGRSYYSLIWGDKVSGDFRGIIKGSGRSVLAEVKFRSGEKLKLSDLEKHQINALDLHNELGGLSLLVWVNDDNVFVLRWPIIELNKKGSITRKEAENEKLKKIILDNKNNFN